MIGGQVIDLASEEKEIDYETLRTLHSMKTGELFRASLRSGAILCGMSEEGLAALDNYAAHFGLAFQITDDILDVKGDEGLIGKPVGSDEKNHKTTYPSLFGLEKSYELAKESIEACMSSLERFGPEADFLRRLACYVLVRES
jgi:geranylgeranyl diphosphate synthase type II